LPVAQVEARAQLEAREHFVVLVDSAALMQGELAVAELVFAEVDF
jgi:hypothetical protein